MNIILSLYLTMQSVFIGGIPASGKSYLANKLSRIVGAIHIDIDETRKEMEKNPALEPWVNFFWNKDEEIYWKTVTCKKHWENLKQQSEAFWPTIKEVINFALHNNQLVIFEGVNILPHLIARDFKLPGIFLLGESLQVILERNMKHPRWGKTKELQRKESEVFFNCEGPIYKKEATGYGFKSFNDPIKAEKELIKLIKTAPTERHHETPLKASEFVPET